MFIYSILQKKPAGALLRASLIVNLLTQTLLWIALRIFFRDYLITLITAEVLIWLVEGALMYLLSGGQLMPFHALLLSLSMNLSSLGVGWFLPV